MLYCVARSRETELIAMHRYHASFSAIASAGVASVRVESIIGVEIQRAKNKGGRILQSRSGDKGSAREVGEYWLNGQCMSVRIFIQASRIKKRKTEIEAACVDGQTCEHFLKIVT